MEQGRYQAAEARNDQAIEAARRIGDQELEGMVLQNQGSVANDIQQYGRVHA